MRKTIKILLIVIAILVVAIILGVYNLGSDIYNYIAEKIDESNETSEARKNVDDNIISELFQNNLLPNNWKYVSVAYDWGTESVNKDNEYYFYIDNEQYEIYKSYWLEGVDKSDYIEGFNRRT